MLDEARWELEFLLQHAGAAPGKPLAGMVHHKVHDEDWTGLPLGPPPTRSSASCTAPSTAATLNLAATAAQGARLFAPYDKAFADQAAGAGPDRLRGGAGPPGHLRAGGGGNAAVARTTTPT